MPRSVARQAVVQKRPEGFGLRTRDRRTNGESETEFRRAARSVKATGGICARRRSALTVLPCATDSRNEGMERPQAEPERLALFRTLPDLQHRQEGLLRDLHAAHALHPFF